MSAAGSFFGGHLTLLNSFDSNLLETSLRPTLSI